MLSILKHRKSDGESMTAFVIMLPLLIMVLLSSSDLWAISLATTRLQAVANAGARYAETQVDAQSAYFGTEKWDGAVNVPASDIEAAALSNGTLESGQVPYIDVSVAVIDDGAATYSVRSWPDDPSESQMKSRSKTLPLTSIEVTATETLPISNGPMRLLMGRSVTISRTARVQVPRRVAV